MLFVPLQIDLCGCGPVGRSIDVDFVVAQRCSHVVHVVHSNGSCVEAWVCIHACQCALHPGSKYLIHLLRTQLVVPGRKRWVEYAIRAARPTLVDEHDVMVIPKRREHAVVAYPGLNSRPARSACQEEDGVWFGTGV